MELFTHSCHAVMSFFWPEDGAGSSYLQRAARPTQEQGRQAPSPCGAAASEGAGGGRGRLVSPLHAEQLQRLPGRQALELVPHDLGLRAGHQ